MTVARTMLDNLNAIVANTLTDSIKMIDIDELHESEDNFFIVDRIEEFADTILGQGGVKDNLIVRPLESGGYEIISGHRRRAAVQFLIDRGDNVSRYLPCLVQEYSDDESKLLDIILMNVSARQISDSELWKSYELIDRILKEKKSSGEKFGRIREKLGELLGVSPAQVGKMQNVEKNAIPAVKEAVEKGDISISTANEIAKLDEQEQEELAKSDLSSVKHKEVRQIAERSVKWDGEMFADIIRERLLEWLSDEEKEKARIMKHDEFTSLFRTHHMHHGNSHDDVSLNGHFDKVVIKFLKPQDGSDVREIFLTWSMAARHIRTWVAEETTEKVDTYINFADESSDIAIEEQEEAAPPIAGIKAATAETSKPKSESTVKKEVDTYINSNDTDEDETDTAAPDEAPAAPQKISLESFVYEHFYDLDSIFTNYMDFTDYEDEINLLNEFRELLFAVKEAERKKKRLGI